MVADENMLFGIASDRCRYGATKVDLSNLHACRFIEI